MRHIATLEERELRADIVHLPNVKTLILINANVDLVTLITFLRTTIVEIGESNGFCVASQVSNQCKYFVRCIRNAAKIFVFIIVTFALIDRAKKRYTY